MFTALIQSLALSISQASDLTIEECSSLIEKPKNTEHGDLAFPCFSLAKLKKVAPQICAKDLAEKIKLPTEFSKIEIIGPFLNFRLNRAKFAEVVLLEKIKNSNNKKLNVVIDYSSPNIAKPFHVGHLRATLIGNCLDRVYRFLGHKVDSVNHLGDWGTQFGFVWAGSKIWGEPTNASVSDLVGLYRKATGLKEEQEKSGTVPSVPKQDLENNVNTLGTDGTVPDVNEMARSYFVDLENGKEYAMKFWQFCVDISLKYLKETYKRLDISFDHYTGESFYSDKLDAICDSLKKANLLVESQGAYGVELGEELGFARITTPDGRSLYLARDLAAAEYRANEFNFDRALYVVGAPQSLHFQQLKAVLNKLGRNFSEKIHHIAFGHVLGMKTRGSGSFIELNEFLDEAIARAKTAYQEQVSKRPEGLDENKVATAVALSAIIYSNLSKNNIKDVNFSWDHALEFQGDSGPYLLYALARINGVFEKATEAGIKINQNANFSLLTEDSAHELVLEIAQFENTLLKTANEFEPCTLANYALNLAKCFSKAYQELKVIGVEKELSEARLLLFVKTKEVLEKSLKLLGMQVIERM